eukprot:4169868-Lingulodinium_polyedra.AAC.1
MQRASACAGIQGSAAGDMEVPLALAGGPLDAEAASRNPRRTRGTAEPWCRCRRRAAAAMRQT